MAIETLNQAHDLEVLRHYLHFQGTYQSKYRFAFGEESAPAPIDILEYAPSSDEYDWLYISLGMSRRALPGMDERYRLELLMYSQEQKPELVQTLAKLTMYPFVHGTGFAPGDTIPGAQEGVVPGSPLTDILLTPVYFEAEGFDHIAHQDGTHTHLLWATPIYPAELAYIRKFGWKRLVEDEFTEFEVQPADLFRPPLPLNR